MNPERKISGEVSISRSSRDVVNIYFRDNESGIEFAVATLSIEAFGYAVTGMSGQPASISVRGLEAIGKKRITEKRVAVMPGQFHSKEAMKNWLLENKQEDGWTISSYLGSQSSVSYEGGNTILHYNVYKFVDPE